MDNAFTLEQLQAYVGAPAVPGATHRSPRGELTAWGWEDILNGDRGWWWALTRPCGDHDVVVGLGFALGDHRDRDIDIARALAQLDLPTRAVA